MGKNTKRYSQRPDTCTTGYWKSNPGAAQFAVGLLLYAVGSTWTTTTRPWKSGDYYAIAAIGLWLSGLLLIGLGVLLSILNTHRILNKE